MRIRIPTMCVPVAVSGVLLFLNLRIPEWVAETYNVNNPPHDADPVTRFLFFRGWPFTPCEYAVGGLSRWDSDGYPQLAAFADVL